MNLLSHQIKYAKGYPDKGLLVHEGGTGKTICAAVWLRDNRDADALVVCPKRVVKKWKKTLTVWDMKATVLSKEDFKKASLREWSARVIDEADEFASPLFTKGRSQLSEKMYEQIKTYQDTPTLLLTATPIRSTSWNLHTLLCFLGKYTDWKVWRSRFFNLESRPFIQWKAWFPKEDWRIEVRKELEKHADIVLLRDCVDELPSVEEEIIKLPFQKYQIPIDLEITKRISDEHRFEQRDKIKEILKIAKEYRKVLIVAYFVDQVEELERQLKKDRKTYMVHGGIKNQENILIEANKCDECFLIVQSSLGAGFDADSFSCVIFASMSYAVRDFVQMKYRVRRIHNLHPVIYIILLSGRIDKAIWENISNGKDFIPSEWQKTN